MYLIAFKFIIMNISNNYGFMVLTQFWHNQIFYTYSAVWFGVKILVSMWTFKSILFDITLFNHEILICDTDHNSINILSINYATDPCSIWNDHATQTTSEGFNDVTCIVFLNNPNMYNTIV